MVERDAKGRFVKGWNGGPGRPPKEREEKYYSIAMNTVTYSDWAKIIAKAAEQARRGDAQARKWLSEYLAPQALRLEHSGADGGLLKVLIEYANSDGDTTETP